MQGDLQPKSQTGTLTKEKKFLTSNHKHIERAKIEFVSFLDLQEFEIDKRIILKIIEEFIEKYNYLSKNGSIKSSGVDK